MAIAYDKTIQAIDTLENLKAKYPDAEVQILEENSLLMPGLINAHVHLEFSANKTDLKYGSFMPWLHSVIKNRDELIGGCDANCVSKALTQMLDSGTTTIGAISSHGLDLDATANSKLNVVYFNEVIGSQATMADALYGDFLGRLESSQTIKREGFIPAIAIHSPYSVHPILIKRAVAYATQHKMPLSAHFMESTAEREWCESNEGEFKPFFGEFLKQDYAVNTPKDFLSLFNGYPTMMTHATKIKEEELQHCASEKHSIIHCPISNRLLGNGALDISALEREKVPFIMGTDGLSSNYTLNLFEEMKSALFMHDTHELSTLAKDLFQGATIRASDALGLNKGLLEVGRDADMIVLDLDKEIEEDLELHLILHHFNVSSVIINGNSVKNKIKE